MSVQQRGYIIWGLDIWGMKLTLLHLVLSDLLAPLELSNLGVLDVESVEPLLLCG